ncbi:MAG: PC4/YdbC family ssDNA-binding protein [Elusimicrobia bacterium]|nr:PC4/YdbC family ssDNA-binding protein [Elusimicrobiota bacterium]
MKNIERTNKETEMKETEQKIEGEVYSFHKNATEDVKCIISKRNGRDFVEIRVFYQDDNNEWQRSRKGITMLADRFIKKLPNIQQALQTNLPSL